MAHLAQRPIVEISVNFELNEAEVGALDALAGYGDEAFLETFYAKMGQSYLKPHEKGLRSLFESVRQNLPSIMAKAKAAREAFEKR